jgi:hypothetical protein
MTSARWQALLGFVFPTNFMGWVWLAFVKPPAYSRWNAFRFAREIYRTVLRGSPTELPEIADERAHSAQALVQNAWQKHEKEIAERIAPSAKEKPSRRLMARQCAHRAIRCQKLLACTLGTLTSRLLKGVFLASVSFSPSCGKRNEVPPRTVTNSDK